MRNNRKVKTVIIVVMASLLLCTGVARFIQLNLFLWPSPEVREVPYGESYIFEGLRVRIVEAKIGSDVETAAHFNPNINLDDLSKLATMSGEGWHGKQIGVAVEIENTTAKRIEYPIYMRCIEKAPWYMAADPFAITLYNDLPRTLIPIEPSETVTVVLPYFLWLEQTTKEKWDNAENEHYSLVWELYPQKISFLFDVAPLAS